MSIIKIGGDLSIPSCGIIPQSPTIQQATEMEKPIVFLSHRHTDKGIANVIKKHLLEWGVAERNIFQSSDPKRAAMAGVNLAKELISKLEKVNLFILIYTHGDEDWSFPMWECGVAQGKGTANTRIVVLQCALDEPEPFRGQKLIKVDEDMEGIRGFSMDFHKAPGFIPPKDRSEAEAFRPETPDSVVIERARRLYEDLRPILPGAKADNHLWDFIRLRLNTEYVDEIRKQKHDNKRCRKILEENLLFLKPKYVGIGYNVNTAVRQFGLAGYEEDLKLADLIENWRSLDKTNNNAWIDDLYNTIYRAVTNKQSPAVAHPFKSVREDVDWWFFAPVTRVRVNRDNSREFDVYLIRLPANIQFSTGSEG